MKNLNHFLDEKLTEELGINCLVVCNNKFVILADI